jgi:hypothetical protein
MGFPPFCLGFQQKKQSFSWKGQKLLAGDLACMHVGMRTENCRLTAKLKQPEPYLKSLLKSPCTIKGGALTCSTVPALKV